jgi:hypothetical protein
MLNLRHRALTLESFLSGVGGMSEFEGVRGAVRKQVG